MKKLLFLFCMLAGYASSAQTTQKNIVIITTDGFRWQEVFGGMDSSIAGNNAFNQWDSAGIFKKYWGETVPERRKKLLPFFWSVIAAKGRLYGNRQLGNNVNVANPYWFSYPGYNEIFTGYADTLVNSNEYPPNPNTTLTAFINQQPGYKNRVAAFGAWDAFERILNEKRSEVPVVNGFEKLSDKKATASAQLLNDVLMDSYRPFGNEECLDVFTHYQALEYLKAKKPKLLYIAYGETDEWAHAARYRDYLDAAHHVDQWIADIWHYLQQDPFYKNNTLLFITTDHGRGDKVKSDWVTHGSEVEGADEIWFAVMGPGVTAGGEVATKEQLYQRQFAQTIAGLLGFRFTCEHPVAEKINLAK